MSYHTCFLLLLAVATKPSAAVSCSKQFELIIMMDSSGRWPDIENFGNALRVLGNIWNDLSLPTALKVAGIGYSADAEKEFDFKDRHVDNYLERMTYNEQETENSAQDTFAVIDQLRYATPGVQKIIVFVFYYEVTAKQELLAAAAQAKSEGYKIMAIVFSSRDEGFVNDLVSEAEAPNSYAYNYIYPGEILYDSTEEVIAQGMCDLADIATSETTTTSLPTTTEKVTEATTNPSTESNVESSSRIPTTSNLANDQGFTEETATERQNSAESTPGESVVEVGNVLSEDCENSTENVAVSRLLIIAISLLELMFYFGSS